MAKNKKPQLEITADATGALNTIKDVGVAADEMGKKVVGAGQEAGRGLEGIGAAGEKTAEKLSRVERSIVNSIQRSTAELKSMGQGSAARFEALAEMRGIDPARIAPYIASLRAAEQQAEALAKANARTGLSTKEMALALRGIPAQFTDIATSLASGQRPLTVLLQQGGQLKDMFGGIGPAARAMGSYVAGLVNPFTVAAVAVGGLTTAWYQGSKEAQEYQRALILTGNAVGATAAQLNGMAEKVAAATGATQGLAAEALTGLAGSGKIAADNMSLVAEAATRMQRAAGIPIADTIKQFEELGREPVKASEKLNEQANYLTETIYRQIKALVDHGKTTEAAALAQSAWADAINTRAPEIVASLGYIERGWKHVSEQAAKAWDFMKGLGRDDSDPLASARATLEKKRQDAASMYDYDPYGRAGRSAEVAQAERIVKQLEAEVKAREAAAAQTAKQNEQTKAGIALAQERDKYIDRETQKKRELARLEEQFNKTAKTDENRDDYLKAVAGVNEKYAEKIKASTKAAKTAVDEFAAVMNRINAKDSGVDASFWKDLQALHAGYQAGRVDADAYADAVRNLTNQQGFAKAAAKAAAEAEESIWKAREKAREEAQRGLATLQGEIEQQQRHNEEIGLTAAGLAELTDRRMQDAIATKEQEFAKRQAEGADLAELKLIDEQIAGLEKLRQLKSDGAARQAVADAAKQSAEEWKRFSDDIERSLTDALMRGFENGESFGKNFVKSLQNTLKTTVLKMAVQAVVSPVMSGLQGALGMGGSVGGGSLLSTGSSLLNMGSSSAALTSAATNFAMSGVGQALGLSTAAGAGYAAPVYAAGGQLLSAGSTGVAAGGITGAGSALASTAAAAPYILAALAIADAVGLFGKRGGPQQGQYGSLSADGYKSSFTMSGGDALGNQALAQAAYAQIGSLYHIAGTAAGKVDLQQGYKLDPQGTANGLAYRNIIIDGKTISGGTFDGNHGEQWRGANNDATGAATYLAKLTSGEIEKIAAAIDSPKLNEVITKLKANFGDLAGAMEKYAVAQATRDTILSAVMTDEERAARDAEQANALLAKSFEQLKLSVPATTGEFRALIEGLDLTTQAGQDTLAAISGLGDAFLLVAEAAKVAAASQKEWGDKLAVLQGKTTEQQLERQRLLASTTDAATKALMGQVWALEDQKSASEAAKQAQQGAIDAAHEALKRAVDAQMKTAEAARDAAQEQADAVRGVFDLLKDQVSGLYGEVSSTAAMNAVLAGRFIDNALSNARVSGHLPESGALGEAINAARGGIDDKAYASAFERDRDQLILAGKLSQLKELSGDQLTIAEQALKAAEQQVSYLEGVLTTAQAQLDALAGINGSVLSVTAAITGLQSAISGAIAASRPPASASNPYVGSVPSNAAQGVKSAYNHSSGVNVGANDSALLAAAKVLYQSATGGVSTAQYNAAEAAVGGNITAATGWNGDPASFRKIWGFKDGGFHTGGLRLVGEAGPELEVTGAARYYSAQQTRALLAGGDNQELLAELRALREDNRAQAQALVRMQARMAKLLERWEGDGMPETRQVA